VALYAHKAAIESYRAIIERLADQHIVDPKRVGIAGHSFSANVVAYGVSHSDLFAAAVIGSGIGIDPTTYTLIQPTVPSTRSSILDFLGLPPPDKDPGGLWKENSPALNAGSIRTPLLIQSPENEFLDALPLFSAIQHAGGVSDMFVFPDEGHMIGRSPVHQYWRGMRSVAWFAFWLRRGSSGLFVDPSDAAKWQDLAARADRLTTFATPRPAISTP
jgi:dipeptidyl aminopeptidase/acylaminoacyl peptidase